MSNLSRTLFGGAIGAWLVLLYGLWLLHDVPIFTFLWTGGLTLSFYLSLFWDTWKQSKKGGCR